MSARACPSWRVLAHRTGMEIKGNSALAELLEALDRIIIRGEGWGPSDPLRGRRQEIELLPSKLARQSRKRQGKSPARSERTYRRAGSDAEQLGLARVTHRPGLPRTISPTWYPSEDPEAVWQGVAERVRMAALCPGRVRVLADLWPGTPSLCKTGSTETPEAGSGAGYPDKSGGRFTEYGKRSTEGTGHTEQRSSLSEGDQSRDPGERAPWTRSRRGRLNVQFENEELGREAREILDQVHGDPAWDGVPGVIGWAQRVGADEDEILKALREADGRWRGGEIESPKGWLRTAIKARCGLWDEPVVEYERPPAAQNGTPAPTRAPEPVQEIANKELGKIPPPPSPEDSRQVDSVLSSVFSATVQAALPRMQAGEIPDLDPGERARIRDELAACREALRNAPDPRRRPRRRERIIEMEDDRVAAPV